jgi:hypothetical protein
MDATRPLGQNRTDVRARLATPLLAIAAFVLACSVAELGLRVAGYVPLYDVYSKPELFWKHDELLGWSLEPGARGRYRGPRPFPIEFDSEIEINSLGLRGPEIPPPEPGELRVLVLGDSFVAGFEVESEQTFVAILEHRLRQRFPRPVRVINAAVRGYGTDQSLLWYREVGRRLSPDLVVLAFSSNDFEDNITLHRARRPFGKGAFALRESGALELVGVPVPRYPLCSAWILGEAYAPARLDGPLSRASCFLQTHAADHSALFTFVTLAIARMPGVLKLLERVTEPAPEGPVALASLAPWPAPPARAADLLPVGAKAAPTTVRESEITTALIQALAREVRSSGARFILMMTAKHWAKVDGGALAADQITPRQVALRPELDPFEFRFRHDAHLNARGHLAYAEGLTQIVAAELALVAR